MYNNNKYHYNIHITPEEQARREQETAAAFEYQKANGLPVLVGTRRQEEWAVVIRLKTIKFIQELESEMNPWEYEILSPYFEEIIFQKNACFFIENRYDLCSAQAIKTFAKKLQLAKLIPDEDEDVIDISHMVLVEELIEETEALPF